MSSENKSFVPCDIAFWKNYSNATGAPYYGWEWDAWYNQSTGTLLAYILFYQDLHRLVIYVVAMMLLGICFVVSLNKKIEDPSMRVFVWNCCFVNALLTVFVCVQWILNSYVYPTTELCYFTNDVLPGTEALNDNPIGFIIDGYGIVDFYMWTVYSVCVSLTFVRSSAYRACTRPMSYKNQEVNKFYWAVVIAGSDLVPVLVIYLCSPVYGPRIPPLMRTIISFGFIAAIWLTESVLSLLSVLAIYRYRNSSEVAKKSMDTSRLRSFILFSVIPSLQLIPVVFMKIKLHLQVTAQQVALDKCTGMDNLYDIDYYDREQVLGDCDVDYYGAHASAIRLAMNEVLNYCLCVVVWKPHCEALMILFLLPRFRAVFIGRIRRLFVGRTAKVVRVTTTA